MDFSQLTANPDLFVLLILRVGLVVLLYLVILQVVGVSRREMRRASSKEYAAAMASTRAKQTVGHLRVIDPGSTNVKPAQLFDIEPVTTIGRAPINTIVLESTFVSTEHTRIIYKDKSLWVEDMGSRNGTLLEQKLVTQPTAVKPNQILQVGDVRFKFEV
ncbi:MAG TPA: FHA domain-containing protein [Ktedonobacterales bacterium]|nr:FHA domain-containing protein [Ktedonobacterales bacterium]